jgi:chromosomal replication initiation ATPase DnaA
MITKQARPREPHERIIAACAQAFGVNHEEIRTTPYRRREAREAKFAAAFLMRHGLPACGSKMYKWREIADNLGFAEHSGAVYAVNAGNRRQRKDPLFCERLATAIEILEFAEESQP